jgi:hypothetical protein
VNREMIKPLFTRMEDINMFLYSCVSNTHCYKISVFFQYSVFYLHSFSIPMFSSFPLFYIPPFQTDPYRFHLYPHVLVWIGVEFSSSSTPVHPTHVDWCESDYIQNKAWSANKHVVQW